MLKKCGTPIVIIIVTAIVTLIINYIWSVPSVVATKSEMTNLVGEAKAEARADYERLDKCKLEKDAFAYYVQRDSELRASIVARQDALQDYVLQMQRDKKR